MLKQLLQRNAAQLRTRMAANGWARPVASSSSSSSLVAASFAGAVGVATFHGTATAMSAPVVTFSSLNAQDSTTSSDVIGDYDNNVAFLKVSTKEMAAILQRDREDDTQLAKGIQIAIEKGVIPAHVAVEPITKVDVMGKSADQVAAIIIQQLGSSARTGCVLTLEGLSGTGKGTTVAMLKSQLPHATTWSNGNIFRALTLLAVTYAEQNQVALEAALTPDNLAAFTKMIHFGKYNGKFDVLIDGLGHKALVSEIQNTTLKGPAVGRNIPLVAGMTQGEVINFVKAALDQMTADGVSVLLEGRGLTLNYIRTPHRFELVLSDELLIGKRRAAQRMMAEAKASLCCGASDDEVTKALLHALDKISKE